MKFLLVLVVTIALSGCSSQTPQSELKTTLAEMLTLIDQGKSRELLTKYADPSDVHSSDSDISDKKLKRLRLYLLKAKEIQPELTESNTVAVYKDPSFYRPLKFRKENGKWLLKN